MDKFKVILDGKSEENGTRNFQRIDTTNRMKNNIKIIIMMYKED